MREWIRKRVHVLSLVLLSGCAGLSRRCSAGCAESFGTDWIVTTSGADGRVINCWKLKDTSLANEASSDGIWWKDSATGHLVHISGWYSRVQVSGGDFESAAAHLGVDVARCPGGRYLSEALAGGPELKVGKVSKTKVDKVNFAGVEVTSAPLTALAARPVVVRLGAHEIRAVVEGDRVTEVALDGKIVSIYSDIGREAVSRVREHMAADGGSP